MQNVKTLLEISSAIATLAINVMLMQLTVKVTFLILTVSNQCAVGSRFIILDINECKTSPCSGSAVCHNSPGSFSCSCLDGYSGDGFICQETILYPFSRTEDKRLPQERNAVAEVPLPFPVKLLGKEFSHFFVIYTLVVELRRR